MKKSMLFVIICAIVMALVTIGCESNIKNTNPMDEKLVNAYVASEYGDEYTYSILDDEVDGVNGYFHIIVYDENGNLDTSAYIYRDQLIHEYFW